MSFVLQKKVAEALEAHLRAPGGGEEQEGSLRTVSWPTEERGADAARGSLPLGFSVRDPSHGSPGSSAIPGLPSREDYHWHESCVFDENSDASHPVVAEVYFPLLAVVLPKWLHGFSTGRGGMAGGSSSGDIDICAAAAAAVASGTDRQGNGNGHRRRWPAPADSLATSPSHGQGEGPESDAHSSGGPKVRRVLFLVSGYGAPRNEAHAPQGNSTEATARLMKRFVEECYPEVVVRLVHSDDSILRYDANVRFVTHRLRPGLERERDAVAATHGDEWPRRFKLTVALCDGAPARLQALMASFRDMQPYLLHMWQLKSFWHKGKLCENEVDIQRWEQAEALPPIPADPESLNSFFAAAGGHRRDAELIAGMVDEMREHRDTFLRIQRGGHELSTFWLRKTQKPVLAVLCVRRHIDAPSEPGKHPTPEFHRGVNLEVSMPTGSLCAERNVIGTALAADPTLRRKDLFGIAVLSLRKSDISRWCGGAASQPPTRDVSSGDLFSLAEAGGTEGAVCQPVGTQLTPVMDLNPLSPCGACKEWLYKIAEVNPGFKVLMFADVNCDEVYIKTVAQC